MLAITTTNVTFCHSMTDTQTQQDNIEISKDNDDVMLHIVVFVSVLITLFIEFLSLLWPSNPSNTKLPQSLVTHHSLPMKQENQPILPVATAELKSETDGQTSSGEKSGTPSQPLKKSRSGSSTRSASRQTKTKSSRITPARGFQS